MAAAALTAGLAENLVAQSLKGSETSVRTMYSYATRHEMEFYKDRTAVQAALRAGALVQLSSTSADFELHEVTYPYVLPETKLFVERLAAQYRSSCGEKLVVTSATRPENMRLRNASELSVHSTGMAVDLRSTKISAACRKFLANTLVALEKSGVIEATRENTPAHFHVAVFPALYSRYVSALTQAAAIAESSDESSGPSNPELNLVSYLVRAGDSLWKIAVRHDTTVRALQDLNKIRGDKIRPGQVILVPSAN
jgi:LysM repeat protein